LSAGEARAAPRAHEITRWLGRDAPEEEPEIVMSRPLETGRLVLCSDGLWNYVPGARDIAALVDALPSGAAPVALARALADAALTAGGRDNITVTVIDLASSTGDGNDHLHS
jgi:serine/threonine protein phosphatase PrpC